MDSPTNKDVVVRFTDEKYARRDEVSRDLGTNLIAPIWSTILSYRSRFSKSLKLHNITSGVYYYCLIPSVSSKISDCSSKLNSCVEKYNNQGEKEREVINRNCLRNIIFYIGRFYGETFTEQFVDTVINNQVGNLQGISEAKQNADNYFKLIKNINGVHHDINDDYLSSLYKILSKKEDGPSIYRAINLDEGDQTVINKIHNGVPANRIERMMNDLFAFLNDISVSILLRAMSAFYFINYVKPFESFNTEIALIVYKTILANDNKESFGYLIPFEILLTDFETFDLDFKEADRGNDLTYTYITCVNNSNAAIDIFLDNCTNLKMSVLRDENVQGSVSEEEIKNNNLDSLKTTKNINPQVVETPAEVAIPNIAAGLDEKDASKFEKYLLEKNPLLKKSQAHFYARHCTIGSYYTIGMYKKAERVVYETARTSMDALKKFGYYRKEQIKNKFVYTPIKLEDKK